MDLEDLEMLQNNQNAHNQHSKKRKKNPKYDQLILKNKSKSNLIQNRIKHVSKMNGIDVHFPYEMYHAQELFISKALGIEHIS